MIYSILFITSAAGYIIQNETSFDKMMKVSKLFVEADKACYKWKFQRNCFIRYGPCTSFSPKNLPKFRYTENCGQLKTKCEQALCVWDVKLAKPVFEFKVGA